MLIAVALLLPLAAPARPVPFEQDGRWGYRSGRQVVIEPRFVVAHEFSPQDIAAVVDEHGWAYIDRHGKVVVRPMVVDNGPDYFKEGLARFTADGKVGFFDQRGRVVIQPRYAFAAPFSGGRAAVCDGCQERSEGEHRFVRGGRWGFIDRAGTLVIPIRFEEVESFEKGRARVKADGRWEYIDQQGRLRSAAPAPTPPAPAHPARRDKPLPE